MAEFGPESADEGPVDAASAAQSRRGLRARLHRRRYWFVTALVLAAFMLLRARPAPPPEAADPPIVVDQIAIVVDEQVRAGSAFSVEVTGVVPGVPVELVVEGGYRPRTFTVTPPDDVATFSVLPVREPESGLVALTASQGLAVDVGFTEMLPGPAVDPLNVYLGPRTVIADEEHFSMIVTVPRDRWGNPVLDGTRVDYTVSRPDGAVEEQQALTENLLAWVNVFSRTKTGRTRIGIEVGGAGGVEESFIEVADIPEPFTLAIVDELPVADGAALVRVRTSVLMDANDNVLPDGTVVFLDMNGVTGLRHLWGTTIQGVAEFTFEAPEGQGPVEMISTASGVSSEPLSITFERAIDDIPVSTLPVATGVRIDLGPIRTVRASFAPDGTTALLVVDGIEYEVLLIQGVASLLVPVPFGESFQVTVLGTTATVEF